MKFLALLPFVALMSACASGFSQFYTDMSQPWAGTLLPSTNAPTVFQSSGEPNRDIQRMYEDGYVLVGQSSFNGPSEGVGGALAQAKKVGAERVVVAAQYTRTVAGSIPSQQQHL